MFFTNYISLCKAGSWNVTASEVDFLGHVRDLLLMNLECIENKFNEANYETSEAVPLDVPYKSFSEYFRKFTKKASGMK